MSPRQDRSDPAAPPSIPLAVQRRGRDIQNARRYYNAVVRDLNTKIAQFPSNLVAGPMGFQAQEFFGLASESEGAVPRVDV